jgi:hypothetical protein
MENFPASFPKPHTSLAATSQPNAVRTAMDSGVVRQRRRFTTENVFVNVRWELNDLEFAVFTAFHKHKLNLGSDWFIISLPLGSGDGFNNHTARFVEGKFDQRYRDVSHWDVTCVLEVQSRVVMNAETLQFYLDNGFTDEAVAALIFDATTLHSCVHVTMHTNLN